MSGRSLYRETTPEQAFSTAMQCWAGTPALSQYWITCWLVLRLLAIAAEPPAALTALLAAGLRLVLVMSPQYTHFWKSQHIFIKKS
jgi:hypothetical protein